MPDVLPAPQARARWRWWVLPAVALAAGALLVAGISHWPQADAANSPIKKIADVPLPGGPWRQDYQSLDANTGQLFIAQLGASMVTVFNTRTNKVVGKLTGITEVHGVLAVPELGRVYASATGDNTVDVIDEKTLTIIASAPTGDYPDGIAYDPDDHKIFVSNESGGSDTVIDTNTNKRITDIDLGGDAGNTQYDPVSHTIYVDVQTQDQLVAINPRSDTISARYTLPATCDNDHGLNIDAANRLAFIACDGNATLLVFDLTTMRVTQTLSTGVQPDVLAFDSGYHLLYVACESGVVSLYVETGRSLKKIAQGYVAYEAHTISVDSATHRVYLPLENVGGRPVLRIGLPTRHGSPVF